jgi:protein O-GlcNAc transferase
MTVALASPASPDLMAEGRSALFAGNPALAATLFNEVAQADPGDFESRYWLYSALVTTGGAEAAHQALQEARDLHAIAALRGAGVDMERIRDDKAYCAQIGMQLYAANMMGPASFCLGRALDFEALQSQTMLSYALSLQHQGRMDEAIDVFTALAEIFKNPQIHQFLLYPLFHAQDRVRRVSEETRKWADLYAAPLTPAKPAFANDRTPGRRLRVGYLAPNFTRGQLAQFIVPVLEAHNPEAVEVFVYCADPAAETTLPASCKIRSTGGVSDTDVVAQIRLDRIDILVDLWGYTAGSRMTVFARRPAPIQISWMNFIQTTGLACMDYVLHGDCMKVDGTAPYFTEEIWYLGDVMTPSRPAADRPDPTPTPALKNGYVTFGAFINPAKLNEMTIAAWALILRDRPDDRLVLKYGYFVDPVLQRVTRARFAAYGARPEQLEFRGRSDGVDYLREFQDIDLALDPSPCPGGTGSFDALANGVPVLTQMGDDFYARIGPLIALPCGLPELVADDWDDYIVRAHALTADLYALNALRAKTRAGYDASPYRDEAGFILKLESAYCEMFARWVAADAEAAA